MREIKFRGKRVDNGELVYGDLIHGVGWKKGEMYILPLVHNLAYLKGCDPLDGYKIDPESIGQYIGLKDKNNKDIFSGDILSRLRNKEEGNWASPLVHLPDYFSVVTFKNGMFVDEYTDRPIWEIIRPQRITDNIEFEVVGNIYENTELLSGSNAV